VFYETREISSTNNRLQASQVLLYMTKVIIFVTCWPRCSSYRIENLMLNNYRHFLLFQKIYFVTSDFERNSQTKEINSTPSISDSKQFSTWNLPTH